VPAGVVKWNATVNNTTVDLIEIGNVEYEIWTPGQFQFTVPNDSKHRSVLLGSDGYAGAGKEVRLYREVNDGGQTLMMKGPVYTVRIDNRTIQVGGRGKGIELARSYTGDNEYFLAYPATKVISHILHGTNFTLGETGANPPSISCRFYTENKWRALMDTVKNFTGWEARVETDDTITFKEEVGTDRSASFVMRYGYNVVSDGAREINYEDLVTRVIVRGEGEGFNQVKASVVDATAESQYWPRIQVYDDRSIDNFDLAQNVAKARLSAAASPRDQISLQTTDMYDPTWTLELGDTVAVDWPQLALNQDMRIRRISYRWGMDGETISMDLNKERKSLARAMAGTNPGIRQSVETEARHPQGATNVWQLGKHDNVDSSNPLVIPFFIPEEVKKINRAKFNLNVGPIRYYQKVVGPGDYRMFYQGIGEYHQYPDISAHYTTKICYKPAGVLDWRSENNLNLGGEGGPTGLVFDGTGGMIYTLHIRPRSYVDCNKIQLRLKNDNLGVTFQPWGMAYQWLEPDGHEDWYNFSFFMPRMIWGSVDVRGETFSWLFLPYTKKSWTEWDYWIEGYAVNLAQSGAGTVETSLYEESYDSITVTAYIKQGSGAYQKIWSGTEDSSANLTVTDINFKNYITSGVWHHLKFEASDNCNINAEAYIEGYAQSR